MAQREVRYVPCQDCPLRVRRVFRPFTEPELQFVAAMKSGHVAVASRVNIVEAGQVGAGLMTLFEGWAIRYRRGIGGRRHILSILLPGDLIAAESALLGRVEHSVMAITPVTLCVLDGRNVHHLFAAHPDLAIALYRNQLDDMRWFDVEAVDGSTGDALARVAYVLLRTFERLGERGLANGAVCPFPLRRTDLADRVGLSAMHLSRTLAALKRQRLASLVDGTLHIPSRTRLARLVHYRSEGGTVRRAIL